MSFEERCIEMETDGLARDRPLSAANPSGNGKATAMKNNTINWTNATDPALDYEREEAFHTWFYAEVDKADRGEPAQVRREGNVIRLLLHNHAHTPNVAVQYATERDWYVFPANLKDGAKKSHKSIEHSGTNWGYTKDVAEIRRDFTKWPLAGIGVPTGRINNIIDIETDTAAGHGNLKTDGAASLAKLETELGPLPETAMFESPSGSVHRLFNYPKHLADIWINPVASKLAPGCDVCADGDMMIAPPSARADGVYRWCNDLPMADLPEAWIKRLIEISSGAKAADKKGD